jgi:hypothetical protein
MNQRSAKSNHKTLDATAQEGYAGAKRIQAVGDAVSQQPEPRPERLVLLGEFLQAPLLPGQCPPQRHPLRADCPVQGQELP